MKMENKTIEIIMENQKIEKNSLLFLEAEVIQNEEEVDLVLTLLNFGQDDSISINLSKDIMAVHTKIYQE